jgi:hypothetical protein
MSMMAVMTRAFAVLAATLARAGAETSTAGVSIDRLIDIALGQRRGHLSAKPARRKHSVELNRPCGVVDRLAAT